MTSHTPYYDSDKAKVFAALAALGPDGWMRRHLDKAVLVAYINPYATHPDFFDGCLRRVRTRENSAIDAGRSGQRGRRAGTKPFARREVFCIGLAGTNRPGALRGRVAGGVDLDGWGEDSPRVVS